ncbi:MAG: hypothetical protein RJA70_1209 [Pseudomonadota bacterium]|jgi:hypothetical protein
MAKCSWKVCSSCRKEIGFSTVFYRCSVTTCQSKRTGLFFCSMPCFEAHLPMMRHRDAWAEQERSPTEAQAAAEEKAEQEKQSRADEERQGSAGGEANRRRIVSAQTGELVENTQEPPKEVLVVTSKLKAYVKARSGMNTSDGVVSVLSDHLRRLSILALRHAAQDGRRTVMDRDFEAVLKDFK